VCLFGKFKYGKARVRRIVGKDRVLLEDGQELQTTECSGLYDTIIGRIDLKLKANTQVCNDGKPYRVNILNGNGLLIEFGEKKEL